jgi:hypothetical protein
LFKELFQLSLSWPWHHFMFCSFFWNLKRYWIDHHDDEIKQGPWINNFCWKFEFLQIHAVAEGVGKEYWIRLLMREFTEGAIFFHIG